MSNCKFLKKFNHFATAKREGIIISTEYASNLIAIANLTDKALTKGILKDANNLDMIYQWFPDSPAGYSSMNHRLENVKEIVDNIANKYQVAYSSKYTNINQAVKQK